MYPESADHIRPVPPVRSEFNRHAQEETLLPPKVPKRMDKPEDHDRPISRRSLADAVDQGLRRVSILRILNCSRLEKRNSIASYAATRIDTRLRILINLRVLLLILLRLMMRKQLVSEM